MEKKKILSILILSSLLALSSLLFYNTYFAEGRNDSNESNAVMQWEDLKQKYPDDIQVHALHALRTGLFFKVGRGDITSDQATVIYESMRSSLINAKERNNQLEETSKNEKEPIALSI